jgi:hypothetical protein
MLFQMSRMGALLDLRHVTALHLGQSTPIEVLSGGLDV